MEPVTTAGPAPARSRGAPAPRLPAPRWKRSRRSATRLFIVALGWRAFTLTGKASSLGIVLSVEALGLITTLLIGGVLADRHSRRLLMIGSDVSRALIVAGLALVDATGHLQFGVLIGFVALHGLGSGLFQPAFGGILPLLVEEPSLGSANALIGALRQAVLASRPRSPD